MPKKIILLSILLITVFSLAIMQLGWKKQINITADKAYAQFKSNQFEEKSKETIVLPNTIYVLQGTNDKLENVYIFFRNIIKGNFNNVSVKSNLGTSFQDRWEFISNTNTTFRTNPLTVTVKNKESISAKFTTNIEVVPVVSKTKVNLLCIGDSMTRPNAYGKRVQEVLPNVQTVGTRTYDDGVSNGEGRGGWTINDYMTKIGNKFGADSPFLFPSGVSGSHYLGNTEFWKNVIYKNPKGYDFEGFQKIASGWVGNNYLFNQDGYPLNPKKDDVIVDPNQPEGQQFLKYDGLTWKVMQTQPEYEFSFSKYMERYNVAYTDNKPTVVTLLLGANDFQSTDDVSDMFLINMDKIIKSVREFDPNIKIIVNLPVIGNTQDIWNAQGLKGSSEQYRENMQILGRKLIDEYDGKVKGVYVNASNTPVGLDNLKDALHPNEEGYNRIGDSLSALIQKIRNSQ